MRKISKAFCIIAFALWITTFAMAYVNTWASWNVTQMTSPAMNVTGYPAQSWFGNYYFTNESKTILIPAQYSTTDTFPHSQFANSNWLTLYFAIAMTIVAIGVSIKVGDINLEE